MVSIVLRIALFAACLAIYVATGAAFAAATADLAFVDVNTVPMDSERVVPHQTVIVHGDTIKAVGAIGQTAVPAGALRIEGNGVAFLTPGLADMHVHVSDDDDLGLYIAHGVTTVLHMGGSEQRIVGTARENIKRGVWVGPQMYFSLMVDGPNPFSVLQANDAEQARDVARLAKANGYDFIKVYNEVTPEAFDVLVKEGRRLGLPVVGHQVEAIGLPAALFRGQVMVAHAEEFLDATFMKDAKTVAAVVADVKRSGAFVTPLCPHTRLSPRSGAIHPRCGPFSGAPRLNTCRPRRACAGNGPSI